MTPAWSPSAGSRADQEGPEDYSYDLAHEVPPPARTASPTGPTATGGDDRESAAVDPDGDYSYDLAHEFPPQQPRA